jgi:hypothetical protein
VTVYVSPEDLVLLIALIGYTTWWASDLRKGARVRRWALGLHLVVYGLAAFYIWAVSLGEIGIAGAASSSLSWLWTLVLTTVAVVGTESGLWYGRRRVVVERTETGAWRYRGPVNIALFWLSLYLIRFTLEDGLLGGYSVFLPAGAAPSGIPLTTFVEVVLLVASIYLLSFGFMLGISIDLWIRHGKANAAPAPTAPAPSPTSEAPRGAYTVPTTLELRPYGPRATPGVAAAYPGFVAFSPSGPGPVRAPAANFAASGAFASSSFCPACGSANGGSDRFCGECGKPVVAPVPPPVPPPAPRSIEPGRLAPVEMTAVSISDVRPGAAGSMGSRPDPDPALLEVGSTAGSIPEHRTPEMFCPHCQQSVGPGERFCGSCGRPLGFSSLPASVSGPGPASRSPGRFCPHCDEPIGARERFCGRCGKPVLLVSS